MAALACFNEQGVEACTIAAICQRAQASVGSVYHHFGSKEGLAGVLYCEGLRRFQGGYLAALEQVRDARGGIAALVRFHLHWVARHPDWARYLLRTRADALEPQAQQVLEEINGAFFDAMGQWFGTHVRQASLRRLPRSLYVALLVGPCQEWARQHLRDAASEPLDDACVDALADAIWCALRAPAGDLALARTSAREKAPSSRKKSRP